jgi:hypothetical protein
VIPVALLVMSSDLYGRAQARAIDATFRAVGSVVGVTPRASGTSALDQSSVCSMALPLREHRSINRGEGTNR